MNKPLTHRDLFPWAWDGGVRGTVFECELCGAAVASTDKHVDWHNSLQQAPGG